MRIFSKPEERINSPLNKTLSSIVPVVYGAVLSYSMYVMSRILLGLFLPLKNNGLYGLTDRSMEQGVYALIIFIAIILFMMQDVGSVYKLADVFPYKRTSRYTYEIWVASLYVAVFTFLEIHSYVTVFIFSFILLLGGLWCNQFKEEYLNHKSNIHCLMRTEASIYYFFGLIFLFESSFFIALYHEIVFNFSSTLIFLVTYLIFLIVLTYLPYHKHGEKSLDYSVNIIFPDFFFKKLETVSIIQKLKE